MCTKEDTVSLPMLFNSPFKSLYEHGTHIGSEYEEKGDAIIEQLKWDLNL